MSHRPTPTGIRIDPPRSLTEREHEVMEFLLSVDFPDRDRLREELPDALVYQRCGCGCPTIDVTVDGEPGIGNYGPEVCARAHDKDPPQELILFVGETGFSLELVTYGDYTPSEFPPADAFKPPYHYSA